MDLFLNRDIFISRNHNDKEILNKFIESGFFSEDIETNKISIWHSDGKNGLLGDLENIFRQLECCKIFLVLLTANSIKSLWVKEECECAIKKLGMNNVIPLIFDGVGPNYPGSVFKEDSLIWKCTSHFQGKAKDFVLSETIIELIRFVLFKRMIEDNLKVSYGFKIKYFFEDYFDIQNIEDDDIYINRKLLDKETNLVISEDDLLKTNEKLIGVYALGGMGKTEFLKHIGNMINSSNAKDNEYKLATFIECNKAADFLYSNKDKGFIDYLRLHFSNLNKNSHYSIDVIEGLINGKNNELTILLDAFDEVLDGAKRILLNLKVKEFIDKYVSVRMIITSRSFYGSFESFKKFELLGFDKDDMDSYTKNIFLRATFKNGYAKGKETINDFYLEINEISKEITENPLFLTQLVFIYKLDKKVPRSKYDILEATSNYSVKQIDKDRFSELDDINRKYNINGALEYIGYNLLFNEAEINDLLLDYLYSIDEESSDDVISENKDELLKYLKARSLVIENKLCYKIFMDFYAAKYLYNHSFRRNKILEKPLFCKVFEEIYFKEEFNEAIKLFICKIDSSLEETDFINVINFIANKSKGELDLLYTTREILRYKSAFSITLMKYLFLNTLNKNFYYYNEIFYYVSKYNLFNEVLEVSSEMLKQKPDTILLSLVRDLFYILRDYVNIYEFTTDEKLIDVFKNAILETGKSYRNALNAHFFKADVGYLFDFDNELREYSVFPFFWDIMAVREGRSTERLGVLNILDTEWFDDELGMFNGPTLESDKYVGVLFLNRFDEVSIKNINRLNTKKVVSIAAKLDTLEKSGNKLSEFLYCNKDNVASIYYECEDGNIEDELFSFSDLNKPGKNHSIKLFMCSMTNDNWGIVDNVFDEIHLSLASVITKINKRKGSKTLLVNSLFIENFNDFICFDAFDSIYKIRDSYIRIYRPEEFNSFVIQSEEITDYSDEFIKTIKDFRNIDNKEEITKTKNYLILKGEKNFISLYEFDPNVMLLLNFIDKKINIFCDFLDTNYLFSQDFVSFYNNQMSGKINLLTLKDSIITEYEPPKDILETKYLYFFSKNSEIWRSSKDGFDYECEYKIEDGKAVLYFKLKKCLINNETIYVPTFEELCEIDLPAFENIIYSIEDCCFDYQLNNIRRILLNDQVSKVSEEAFMCPNLEELYLNKARFNAPFRLGHTIKIYLNDSYNVGYDLYSILSDSAEFNEYEGARYLPNLDGNKFAFLVKVDDYLNRVIVNENLVNVCLYEDFKPILVEFKSHEHFNKYKQNLSDQYYLPYEVIIDDELDLNEIIKVEKNNFIYFTHVHSKNVESIFLNTGDYLLEKKTGYILKVLRRKPSLVIQSEINGITIRGIAPHAFETYKHGMLLSLSIPGIIEYLDMDVFDELNLDELTLGEGFKWFINARTKEVNKIDYLKIPYTFLNSLQSRNSIQIYKRIIETQDEHFKRNDGEFIKPKITAFGVPFSDIGYLDCPVLSKEFIEYLTTFSENNEVLQGFETILCSEIESYNDHKNLEYISEKGFIAYLKPNKILHIITTFINEDDSIYVGPFIGKFSLMNIVQLKINKDVETVNLHLDNVVFSLDDYGDWSLSLAKFENIFINNKTDLSNLDYLKFKCRNLYINEFDLPKSIKVDEETAINFNEEYDYMNVLNKIEFENIFVKDRSGDNYKEVCDLYVDEVDVFPYEYSKLNKVNSIKFASSVRTIEYAFNNLESLTSLEIPEGVYSIKASFKSCSSLKYVKLPRSLKIISNQAFYDCPSLKELTIRISLKDYLSLENEIEEEVQLDDEMIKIYFK